MRSPASLLFWLIVIVIVAAIAHVFRDADPTPRAATPAGEALAGRAKVVDGDSLQVAGERIRLFGIDAPEARQQCQSVAGRPYGCGRDATRALEAAIGGRSVSCTLLTHDRYNRMLRSARWADAISARPWCAPATRSNCRNTAAGATPRRNAPRATPSAVCGRARSSIPRHGAPRIRDKECAR